jgi:hypothetical protein
VCVCVCYLSIKITTIYYIDWAAQGGWLYWFLLLLLLSFGEKGSGCVRFFLLLWPSHKSPELLHRYLCATCIASLHRRKIRRKKGGRQHPSRIFFCRSNTKGEAPEEVCGSSREEPKVPWLCVCVYIYILHTKLYRATHKRKEKRDEKKKKKKWMRHQERSWCARKWSHKLPPLFSLLEPPPYHPPSFCNVLCCRSVGRNCTSSHV